VNLLKTLLVISSFTLAFTGCRQAQLNVSDGSVNGLNNGCITDNPDGIHCKLVNSYNNFILDSFERTDAIQDSEDFGWRKIINDFGKIISGQAGDNVDIEIFSQLE